ncbi:Na+/H+ antiporter subunit E [Streptosporangium sp. NPDC048047]|uniref:Na+/H+ antiporter subunit E n=1 Tax=Streptosporangium sp. NPDC048047 TaxID=3155748 RepID=UPI00343CE3BF
MIRPDGGRAPRLLGRPVPPRTVAWLTLVWLLLWGELSVANILGGLLAALAVVWLLPLPAREPALRVHPVGLLVFLTGFAADLVVSSARVAFWALRFGTVPPMEIVEVRLRTSSEVMAVLTVVALSALPGSLVLEARLTEGELLLHVLGPTGDVQRMVRADVAKLEARIVAAFGTTADREELR